MANFDPKTTVERLILKYPSLSKLFAEEAQIIDSSLSVEEFCFANGIDVVGFFKKIDEAIAVIEDARRAELQEEEKHNASELKSIESNSGTQQSQEQTPSRQRHNPWVATGLCVVAIYYLMVVLDYSLHSGSADDSIVFVPVVGGFPHIGLLLMLLNAMSAVGCLLLLFWRNVGILALFLGSMLSDILVTALTDNFPISTIIALVVLAGVTRLKVGNKSYRHYLH